MTKFLVTGGTGLLGNNIIRELVAAGHEVSAAVRKSSPREPFAGLNIPVLEVDFESQKSVSETISRFDAVIHSAGLIWFGWKKLEQSRRVNVDITARIAQGCLENESRMVHVSSLDALPIGKDKDVLDEQALEAPQQWNQKVPCNYVVTKKEADQKVREYMSQGLSACIVHPGLMFGPFDWKPSSGELIQAISKLGMFFSSPTGGISVADVREVARATIAAAMDPSTDGQHYILAGHNIPYRSLCNQIADLCGVGHPLGRTGLFVLGMATLIGGVTGLIGKETIVNNAAIRMARLWHYYSSEKAVQKLGYRIPDLNQILEAEIQWLSDQKMIKIRKPTN